MTGYIIGYTIGIIIWGLVWGFATDAVIHNRGYNENWFWWGFFFGFVALIVACTKPQIIYQPSSNVSVLSNLAQSGYRTVSHDTISMNRTILNPGEWRCTCGKINALYVGTCGCGRARNEKKIESKTDEAINIVLTEKNKNEDNEFLNLRKLNEYKLLLDSGVITNEQFENKKKELLNL